MGYDTVATIVSDAAVELGIAPSAADIADPYASTDPNVLQLLRFLKSAGRDLAKHRDWAHLRKEYTFPTVDGTPSYALPSDFRKLVPNSSWDRTTAIPLGGPVDSEYWQFRKAVAASTINFNARFWQGLLYLDPTPGSADTIAYEYQSTYWCGAAAATLPAGLTKDAPTTKDDVIFFDALLMVRRVKLDWKKAKGFDTTTEQDDYDTTLHTAETQDSPASTIYLGGRLNQMPRRMDRWNIPDTGVGQ